MDLAFGTFDITRSLGDPAMLMQVVFQISPRIFKMASKPAVFAPLKLLSFLVNLPGKN